MVLSSFDSTMVSVGISALNFALRMIVIQLIKGIRYNQESQITREIMISVFIMQFVNTGVILLLTNANFEGTPLWFIPIRNQYKDYT